MKFTLQDIEMEVFLGITREERMQKQKILVTCVFEFDALKASNSDDINDTFDYYELYQWFKDFPEDREFNLLERLHAVMLRQMEAKFKGLENIQLIIKKFPFPDGKVVIERATKD